MKIKKKFKGGLFSYLGTGGWVFLDYIVIMGIYFILLLLKITQYWVDFLEFLYSHLERRFPKQSN